MSAWVPRLLLGIGAAALVAALVSIAVGEGGLRPRDVGGVNDVQRLYGGIAQDGDLLGSDEGQVTVSVFNDIQCTDCATFQLEVVDALVAGPVREGEVMLEHRHFSLAPNDTTLAAIAAEAAGFQDRQWQYIDLFVRNQELAREGGVDDDLLREVAEAVPELDVDAWDAAYADPEAVAAVRDDARLAAELELPAEPAVVVSGPRGQRELISSPSLGEIEAAIAAVS